MPDHCSILRFLYDYRIKRALILVGLLLLIMPQAFAQQPRPESANYEIPTDVQAGGGDKAKSTNYLLDDTIGEGNIGASGSPNYLLNAGLQQGASETSLTMNCTGPATLGTLTRTGDTSVNTCAATGYCITNKTTCTVETDNATGYTLSWLISTGTGAAGARTGTGHLNGYIASNRIQALGTGSTVASGQPIAMAAGAGTVNNGARWAARLSSTSDTTGGAGKAWGTDGVSDTWLRVATGASINIASRTSATGVGGDDENVGFRAIIHGTAIVPNDIYGATVTFTAITN